MDQPADPEVGSQIWDMYKAGTRLFTKERLAYAEAQLAQKPEYLFLAGIDGRDCVVHTGLGDGRSTCEAAISFKTIQTLICKDCAEHGRKPSHPSAAFCSLEVLHRSSDKSGPLDLNAIKAEFKENEEKWLASSECRSLEDKFSTMPIPEKVTKIVCFGLGEFCHGNRRSFFQHAAALTMAKLLAQRSGQDVQCFAQDPIYSPQCIEYLQSRGFEILDGVRGFIEVDSTSLVFTASPNFPVKQVITDLARPAVIVWDMWLPEDGKDFASDLPEWVVEERVQMSSDWDITPSQSEFVREPLC